MVLDNNTDDLNQLPSRSILKKKYDSYFSYLNTIKERIEKKLKEKIVISSIPIYKSRIKSFDSYYRKIERVKKTEIFSANKFICITDIIGIRIICPFLEDLSIVKDQIKKDFDVKEVEIKGSENNFREFGYESIHIIIGIPSDCVACNSNELKMKDDVIPQNLVCEIQIRTILQDAWAEVEHELIYKNEFSPFDMPLRRKLASINASLSLADIIFQEIRDYQKKLQNEVKLRRESFYEKVDTLTMFPDSSENRKEDRIKRVSPYIYGTIDDLLLEGLEAHNKNDFDKEIKIYKIIINSKPTPENTALSVIYKHLGMAYFSTNNYDEALKSFVESFHYNNENFRSYYYAGIVYSIKNDYEEAIKCFTISLKINKFQSHAHLHRAIGYYHLHQYEESLRDLASAEKLGLNDKECLSLKNKIVQALGMKM